MGLTLIEKIYLKHSSRKELEDFIYAKVDFCFGNDITAPLAVKAFQQAGFDSVFSRTRIGFICDHFLPARDSTAANNVKFLREFASRFKIKHFYDIQNCGVEHVFLFEQGLIRPGDLVVGADSHTCTYGALGAAASGVGSTDLACCMYEGRVWLRVPQTMRFIYTGKRPRWISGKDLILYTIGKIGVDGALYKAMEFTGPVIRKLPQEDRFSMSNMAIEAGGKAGIFEPDEITYQAISQAQKKRFKPDRYMKTLKSDADARIAETIEIDVSAMEPQVACPHLPSNTRPVTALKNIKLDQVYIGSCTNGRITDLRIAARVLKGKKVKKDTRTLISPATPRVFAQAEKEGLLKIFIESGCLVCPPTCGPCLGGHMGVLARGEVALATTNRNFIGRMGDPASFVYLASPAVAAASAVKGRIAHPDEVFGK